MDDQAEQDRRYWRTWTGKPRPAAGRDEAIERFRRLTVGPDPAGEWDRCRLALANLLIKRAGTGFCSGWSGLAQGSQAWQDGQAALTLLDALAGSGTLDANERGQLRRARARLATGLAILRLAGPVAAGRVPDLAEVTEAGRELPPDDRYAPTLPLITGYVTSLRAIADDSPDEHQRAVELLAAGLEASDPAAPWRTAAQAVLAIVMGISTAAHPAAMPAERIAGLAEQALAEAGTDRDASGVGHILSFLARYSRGVRDGHLADQEHAVADLENARGLLPEDHPLRQMLPAFAYNFLSDRFSQAGALVDRDAAQVYQRAVQELADWQRWLAGDGADAPDTLRQQAHSAHPGVIRALAALDVAIGALRGPSLDRADAAIDYLRRELAGLPSDNRWRPMLAAGLGECQVVRAGLSVSPHDAQAGLLLLADGRGEAGDGQAGELRSAARQQVIAGLRLVVEAASQAGENGPLYHGDLLAERAARAQARIAWLTGDRAAADAAVASLRAAADRTGQQSADRARQLMLLGLILTERAERTGDEHDLDESIGALEAARRELDATPGPARTTVMAELARVQRRRGDHRKAVQTGLAALAEWAGDVLLQTGTLRSLEASRRAAMYAGDLAFWCLADQRADQAVQALELGRAMVLHAATVAADVPALLIAAGHDELAARWQAELAKPGPFPWDDPLGTTSGDALLPRLIQDRISLPSDIRRRVIAALRAVPADTGWLTPPSIEELAVALRSAGYDALVYLIPPGRRPDLAGAPPHGCALVVDAEGTPDPIWLPHLAAEPVDTYNAAHLKWINAPHDPDVRQRWNAALGAVCDWAWEAAAAPILQHAARWRLDKPPRLVLIPTSNLGGVPWHAARVADQGGRPRYAIEDAVFSYAASGRQFARACQRPRPKWRDRPVIIANPTGDLPMASVEAQGLRRLYPDGTFLGQPGAPAAGAGTPEEVLSRLPGGAQPQASLLHCGCHATVVGSLAASHLTLADGNRLTIAQIIAQAEGRDPQAPGFLAVLAACMSDLTDVDHDESLTLASALLAAGAAGVIGARWPTDDMATAQLMVMLHHYLSEDADPADALRAAQLWMLDPNRRDLELLAPELADLMSARSLRQIRSWAAYTYQGS